MAYKVLNGDVRDNLNLIEDESIQCVVTSPPYWGLRDYGVDGQLGLEPTPWDYAQNLVDVFRGIWRVLRDDGTVWLNLGDSYIGGGRAGNNPEYHKKHTMFGKSGYNPGVFGKPQPTPKGLKAKDLAGIPWRVALALQDDGWFLRSDIIWHKTNPMPESVKDRPTRSHEYIFLLTKNGKYYYDSEAIKEDGIIPAGTKGAKGSQQRVSEPGVNSRPPEYKVYDGKRNKRTVWTVPTRPYPEAHFAVYPPDLIEPCILAGTSPYACELCGSPFERIVRRGKDNKTMRDGEWEQDAQSKGIIGSEKRGGRVRVGLDRKAPDEKNPGYETIGWSQKCLCQIEGTGRCVVLDPFAGSGTTLGVAEVLGRDSIGIELSQDYCELTPKRVAEINGQQ